MMFKHHLGVVSCERYKTGQRWRLDTLISLYHAWVGRVGNPAQLQLICQKGANMKFRKKPVVIEAERLCTHNIKELENWCKGNIKGTALPLYERCIDIQTLEGEMRADIGDWIIKGVKGEFYPIKNDVFEATYEPVDN